MTPAELKQIITDAVMSGDSMHDITLRYGLSTPEIYEAMRCFWPEANERIKSLRSILYKQMRCKSCGELVCLPGQ
jgi:hypothetical protein